MKYLVLILTAVAGAKIFIHWSLLMLKRQPKSKLFAEVLLKKDTNFRSKEQIEKVMESYERAPDNLLANNASRKFTYMMQNTLLKREEILLIKRYLESSVLTYEKKQFKNDAHKIHTLIKTADDEVLLNVISFMNNINIEQEAKKSLSLAYKNKIREVQ